MDLDSRAYYKLISVSSSNKNFEQYCRIRDVLYPLREIYDHETPEMWCSRIRDPFRKILEENPRILSMNGYINMCGGLYESDKKKPNCRETNYIYCSVCDSLVFLPVMYCDFSQNQDNHLKRCITGDAISNEHARREEILQSIDNREFIIWKYKQFILEEEAKLKRLQLELFSQSTSHSEKDKLVSVSYDSHSTSYEIYAQSKATVAKNTMPSVPTFEPACISVTSGNQEMISPTSYQLSAPKGTTSEIFISSRYAKQNNLLPSINHLNQPALRLKDGTKITFV
jgi:hypothetical protein